jgi:hypothetical protein
MEKLDRPERPTRGIDWHFIHNLVELPDNVFKIRPDVDLPTPPDDEPPVSQALAA